MAPLLLLTDSCLNSSTLCSEVPAVSGTLTIWPLLVPTAAR
jgi:hypothetical protein